jgi:excisionase family DNA binding protein
MLRMRGTHASWSREEAMKWKDYMTPSQAARRIGVSVHTIKAWIKKGRMRCIETPLGRLIPVSEVERLAREHEQKEHDRDER